MPDVIGLPATEAEQAVLDAGVHEAYVHLFTDRGEEATNQVCTQLPEPGTEQSSLDLVTIFTDSDCPTSKWAEDQGPEGTDASLAPAVTYGGLDEELAIAAVEITKDNVTEVDEPAVHARVVSAYFEYDPQLDITYATDGFVLSPPDEVVADVRDILADITADRRFDHIQAFCIERLVPFMDPLGSSEMGRAAKLCIGRDVLARTDFDAMDRDDFWQFAQGQRYPEDGLNLMAHHSIAS